MDGISFSIARGESVGLVGESGCGKSTTSMMVMRLIDKSSGMISFAGEDIGEIPARKFATLPAAQANPDGFPRPDRQPQSALHGRPRHCRPDLAARRRARPRRDPRALRGAGRRVGLPLELLDRFPHQLSGGQKARVEIARAIALKPDLVILDEPTAALDVSVQAVVLNLLQDLKDSLGMSYLFVSHDLNVVRLLCDRVIVMQAGKIVEQGPPDRVMGTPKASYTRDLFEAIPHPPIRRMRRGEDFHMSLIAPPETAPDIRWPRKTRAEELRLMLADEIVRGALTPGASLGRNHPGAPFRRVTYAGARGDPPAGGERAGGSARPPRRHGGAPERGAGRRHVRSHGGT